MTEVQGALLALLKEIDEICRKYDIEYYLGGGTFIGAIRHGGFLPWDDDADVNMSRENALKFMEAVKKENRANRQIFHASFGGGYKDTMLRYQNTSATLYVRGYVGVPNLKGQYVDIFINYPLPDNERQRRKCLNNFDMYSELRSINSTFSSLRSDSFIRKYMFLSRLKRIIGHDRLMRYYEKRIFDFPEKETSDWFIGSVFLPNKVTVKSYWGKPKYIPFEDTMLPIAEHGEKVLSYTYGPNWFEVPSYTERGMHVFVIDLDIPYTVYDDDIKTHFNSDQFLENEVTKKGYWFSLLQSRNSVMPICREMQGICTVMELQQTIEDSGLDVMKLVEQGKKKEIEELFRPFLEKATSDSMKYYGVYLDLPDVYLYVALFFQCFDGNYGIARKLLSLRRNKSDRPLSLDLQRLCDLCDATDALLESLYGDLDMEKSRMLVDEWLEKEPNALYFMRADIYLRLNYMRKESQSVLLERCDRYLQQYVDDGELLKYRGDLLLEAGNIQEGETCYRKALANLKNGFRIKEIKKYFSLKSLEAIE